MLQPLGIFKWKQQFIFRGTFNEEFSLGGYVWNLSEIRILWIIVSIYVLYVKDWYGWKTGRKSFISISWNDIGKSK